MNENEWQLNGAGKWSENHSRTHKNRVKRAQLITHNRLCCENCSKLGSDIKTLTSSAYFYWSPENLSIFCTFKNTFEINITTCTNNS